MKYVKLFFTLVSLLGFILGPVSWYQSVSFFNEFEKLKTNGKESIAIAGLRHNKQQYRYNKFYVNLNFVNDEGQKIVKNDVEVSAKLYDKLFVGKEVGILYDNDTVILTDNYQNENVPPIRKRYWGMGLTVFSFFYLFVLFILKRNEI